MGEFLQKLRKLPRTQRVRVMWLAVVLSSLLIFWGWTADLSSMLAQVSQRSISQSQGRSQSVQAPPSSFFASFQDLYQDLKDIFSGTRRAIKVEKQSSSPQADQNPNAGSGSGLETQPNQDQAKPQLKVKTIKPGGLPLE